MKKTLMAFVAGVVLVAGTLVFAQGGTATAAKALAWEQPGATVAEAQAMTYRFYADGSQVGTVLNGVFCAGAPVVCQVGFPAFAPGAHTIALSAENAAGEGPRSASIAFTFVVVPSAPTGLRIQ